MKIVAFLHKIYKNLAMPETIITIRRRFMWDSPLLSVDCGHCYYATPIKIPERL